MRIAIITAVAAAALGLAAAFATVKPAAPEVRFATLAGESLATSDLRGKVVLVNFWATWCTTCVREMPKMVETYRKYAPQGYEMIAVAVQSDHPNQVAQFARDRALPFRVALDSTGEIAQRFGEVNVTPVSVLIDKEGRIVRQFIGEPDWAELHSQVEKLLAS